MSLWSSSYRGRAGYASDSGSDIADATDTNNLIREMDLSGRHETVEYRPNPWSIARINAASRTSLPKPSLARTKSPPKPQHKPIVEAFKKQAKRAPLVRDESIGAKRGASRQGCESATQAVPLHLPSPRGTFHVAKALEQQISAHISDQFSQPVPPFKPRRSIGTHRAPRSSPVRLRAPLVDRPTFPRSSPGPRPHVAVSGKILSSPGTW